MKFENHAPLKLVQSLGEIGTAAYTLALAHLWDRASEITAEERRRIPDMLRREILLDRTGRHANELARDALGRVWQNLQVLRSAQRTNYADEENSEDGIA